MPGIMETVWSNFWSNFFGVFVKPWECSKTIIFRFCFSLIRVVAMNVFTLFFSKVSKIVIRNKSVWNSAWKFHITVILVHRKKNENICFFFLFKTHCLIVLFLIRFRVSVAGLLLCMIVYSSRRTRLMVCYVTRIITTPSLTNKLRTSLLLLPTGVK